MLYISEHYNAWKMGRRLSKNIVEEGNVFIHAEGICRMQMPLVFMGTFQ